MKSFRETLRHDFANYELALKSCRISLAVLTFSMLGLGFLIGHLTREEKHPNDNFVMHDGIMTDLHTGRSCDSTTEVTKPGGIISCGDLYAPGSTP